jgi:hypothetical protein
VCVTRVFIKSFWKGNMQAVDRRSSDWLKAPAPTLSRDRPCMQRPAEEGSVNH